MLTVLHPDLPVFIRDKYSHTLGTTGQRILDCKAEILSDSEQFLLLTNETTSSIRKIEVNTSRDDHEQEQKDEEVRKLEELKMELDCEDQNEVNTILIAELLIYLIIMRIKEKIKNVKQKKIL